MTTTRPSGQPDGTPSPTRDLYRTAFADPAESADRPRPGGPRAPRPSRLGMTMSATLLLLTGIWLIAAPFLLDYVRVGGIDGSWNSVVTGAAVAFLALGLSQAGRVLVLAVVTAGLGGWLLLAQHVLGYSGEAPRAAVNETACGVLVIMLALAGLGFALADRREPEETRSA